jgi:hypothetical protein
LTRPDNPPNNGALCSAGFACASSQRVPVFKGRHIFPHKTGLLVILPVPLQTTLVELAGELKFKGRPLIVGHYRRQVFHPARLSNLYRANHRTKGSSRLQVIY